MNVAGTGEDAMYYRVWPVVMHHMKEKFLRQTGFSEDVFFAQTSSKNATLEKQNYYLQKMGDNLMTELSPFHLRQFAQGKSALSNLSFLASACALSFNLFGNEQSVIVENTYDIPAGAYQLEYKRTFRTLKSKNAFAGIDVWLYSKENRSCICMETQVMEWFVYKVNPIKDTFMKPENYYFSDTAPVFIETIRMLVPFFHRDAWEHTGCFQYFDGFQLVRQLLGLYNQIRLEREGCRYEAAVSGQPVQKQQGVWTRDVRQLTVITMYWRALHPECYGPYSDKILNAECQMNQEARQVREIAGMIRQLFREELDIALQLYLLPYDECLQMLQKTEAQLQYLKRYEL